MGRSLFEDDDPRDLSPARPVRLPLDCPDADILAVARRWTERLVAEDYVGAWDMLLHRPKEVWAPTPDVLRARIVNYGSPDPIPGEPVCVVTLIEAAAGSPWRWLPSLKRERSGNPNRPDVRGRLEWQLPLNGAWSDLVASFDLVDAGGELAFVLAALRVP
jgi:hypothetical protein